MCFRSICAVVQSTSIQTKQICVGFESTFQQYVYEPLWVSEELPNRQKTKRENQCSYMVLTVSVTEVT